MMNAKNLRRQVPTRSRLRYRYAVVHDPLPVWDGGFAPGVVFNDKETRAMLRLCSFTPGTLLRRVRDGSVWEVVDGEGAQVLRPAVREVAA